MRLSQITGVRPFIFLYSRRETSGYALIIDVAAKGVGVTLLKRFQYERDQRTRPNQSGFMPGRGCTDQMHNLRRILEQRRSFQQATVMCFVDFASAFDCVDRGSLWQIMAADGMPPTLLRLIKAYYS